MRMRMRICNIKVHRPGPGEGEGFWNPGPWVSGSPRRGLRREEGIEKEGRAGIEWCLVVDTRLGAVIPTLEKKGGGGLNIHTQIPILASTRSQNVRIVSN